MTQIKTRGTRPILSEDLLDTEDKRVFVAKMNYQVMIPRLFVRINASYFQRLS
jgi:hypothetical protein